ncbi:V/A-type H+-transporting ATPase subunit D [Hydrogenoanaerobacterium saccharovorans]|uniref:V-type ATP synthase subunit D n=1 Tax=Hydrogenoanaerobacterium saccharovorans TaxID=474960 RepID=A0A1H8AEZ9_9FIRM|nr:V-type ATP synthase subunit D [Hydrogenoanaerobacterium saccharovorans]RPF47976.1 V/A-type H+-transporting ATPase subunit D [Hydrogenoanaerobacterium saccharovorans]SEM69422.1 V/A-type H+-transporting ATPase subunit D [Hydrogenoanaerobacterium saccharovorans]
MNQQVFPTKGNLIATKKTLSLSTMGYDLLDRKRNILIREMMLLIDKSKLLRREIDGTYERAYRALQHANMTLGVIENIARTVPVDDGIKLHFRSVMGVDIPIVDYHDEEPELSYGFLDTNSQLDYAYRCFHEVKKMTVLLAEVENSVYKLANAIVKTQRRANALKNVVIPRLEETTKFITDSLEEKEREEFSRLKVIKATKTKNAND